MRRGSILVFAFLLPALLSACGLKPLYEGGRKGAAAQRLSGVEVAPIAGKSGWLIRNSLAERLHAVADGAPRYRLTIEVDDKIEGLGVRSNNIVTRERRTLRAHFRLRDIGAAADAAPMLDEVVSSDVGIDVTSSEYATVAAEDSALERLSDQIADRILARIAVDAVRDADARPARAGQ